MAGCTKAFRKAALVVLELADDELIGFLQRTWDPRTPYRVVLAEGYEGGLGALAALAAWPAQETPHPLKELAATALKLMHLGEEEACERACYDCLMDYGNQAHHPLLERNLVLPFFQTLREAAFQEEDEEEACPEFAFLDAWGLYDWDLYKSFPRIGRGVPLTARERRRLFDAFQRVWERLEAEGHLTFNGLLHRLREKAEAGELPRFRAAVVDEAQDLGPAELLFLRAVVEKGPDDLFFALDPAQRIYREPLSWQAMGLEVRGRSTRLKVNYRTTREIAQAAERLLPPEVEEEVREVLSLLRGPAPSVRGFATQEDCTAQLVAWVKSHLDFGVPPEEIGVLTRLWDLAEYLQKTLAAQGVPATLLSDGEEQGMGVRVGTVHSAKGLEFRAVAVFGANRNLFPLESLLRKASSEEEREQLQERDRNLLYVAFSRAREGLWVGYWGEPSPLLPT